MPIILFLVLVMGLIMPSSAVAVPEKASVAQGNQPLPTSDLAADLGAMVSQSHDLVKRGEFSRAWVILEKIIVPLEEQVRLGKANRSVSPDSVRTLGGVYLLSGEVQTQFGKYDLGRQFYDKAQNLGTEHQDPWLLASALNALGDNHRSQNNLPLAQSHYAEAQRLVSLHQEWGRRGDILQGRILFGMAEIDRLLGKLRDAREKFTQVIQIGTVAEEWTLVADGQNGLGHLSQDVGNYGDAEQYYQTNLTLAKQHQNRYRQGIASMNLALNYRLLGRYAEALRLYQQAADIFSEIQSKPHLAAVWLNQGVLYRHLGQFEQSAAMYRRALADARQMGNSRTESLALNNLGTVYLRSRKYDQALEVLQESLAIKRQNGDRRGEATSLRTVGFLYFDTQQYPKARAVLDQALVINLSLNDQISESLTRAKIGEIYLQTGMPLIAHRWYAKAMALRQGRVDPIRQADMWETIAKLHRKTDPLLAIAFYKQSINLTESIRQDLSSLSDEDRQRYLTTVSSKYRVLADLLLQQDRNVEALEVLDLLRVQELQDFFQEATGNERTALGVPLLPQEQAIITAYIQELPRFAAMTEPFWTVAQFLQQPQIAQWLKELKDYGSAMNLSLPAYRHIQERLQKLREPTALFYPLVLEDRLELLVFFPNQPPVRRTVPVKRQDFEKLIQDFRADLLDYTSWDVRQSGRKLYQWLIAPITADLTQAQVQNLLYAPDGQMRYIPLSALYDGQHWLTEKYRINYLTALNLMDISPRPTRAPRALVAGFTDDNSRINIGARGFQFGALPAVNQEIQTVQQALPQTTALTGNDFNRAKLSNQALQPYNLIHLATHAKLVSQSPAESFILLNNNEFISLNEVKNWQLPQVDLMVFSACQTALGGELSSGIEIIGFGYQLQKAKVRSVVATLWEINDQKTSELMQDFYQQLNRNQFRSAESLRQAQIQMIRRRNSKGILTLQNHPYYWAAFILIGNGS